MPSRPPNPRASRGANAREADAPRRRGGDRSADRGRVHRVSRPLRREEPRRGRSRPARTGWRRSIIHRAPASNTSRSPPARQDSCRICFVWDDERHPVDMPSSKELRFEPGTTIGGIVKDEAGQPIAGARVDVIGPPTECEARPRASRSAPRDGCPGPMAAGRRAEGPGRRVRAPAASALHAEARRRAHRRTSTA